MTNHREFDLDASSRCFEAGVRKHSPCSTKLRPKKCRINVSAFCAEIFADSQVSPRRKNVHIPDKDLRVSILSKRRKPKRFAKGAKTQKAKFRAGGAEIARRPSSDIFEESAFAPLENTEM